MGGCEPPEVWAGGREVDTGEETACVNTWEPETVRGAREATPRSLLLRCLG